MMRLYRVFALAMLLLATGFRPGAATEVDLELVLAVDVSRSMDDEELELQRQGYAGAFRHQAIVQAIRAGAQGRIAVTMAEWAGSNYQKVPRELRVGRAVNFAHSTFAELCGDPVVSYVLSDHPVPAIVTLTERQG